MKKLFFALALLSLPFAAHAYTYTCYRYVDGHPTGTWIKVKADSKDEAEDKAYRRMKEIGGAVDYARCK